MNRKTVVLFLAFGLMSGLAFGDGGWTPTIQDPDAGWWNCALSLWTDFLSRFLN